MIVLRAQRPAAGAVSFTTAFACPCGRSRTVQASGIVAELPFETDWLDAGPCSGCQRSPVYRIRSAGDVYLIEVDHDAERSE